MNERGTRIGLMDVLVAAVVCAGLLAAVTAAGSRAREQGNRIKCASNLRMIGLGIQMYANDNRGNFPRTFWSGPGDANPVPTEYTASNIPKTFSGAGPMPNDVTAALFLVLKTQDLTGEVFVCPADTRATAMTGNPQMMSNWLGRQNLSYSYQNPYPSAAAISTGFKLNFTLSSDFALASDMNPGGPQMTQLTYDAPPQQIRKGNSNNHNADGQNVLYADGHVEFQGTPFAGMTRPVGPSNGWRDNIFTAGGPTAADPAGPTPVVQSASLDALDSVLLPVAPEGPSPIGGGPDFGANGPLIAAGAAVLGAIVLAVLVLAFKARKVNAVPPPLPPGT